MASEQPDPPPPVAPPLTAGPPMIDPHREHLAFVAVMNALDVHMPPDGAALLTELRAIAATVGYPWRGNGGGGAVKPPLAAGPVAPPPDDEEMVRHAFTSRTPYEPGDDRDIWCADCEYHREHPIHGSTVGEAPRGAARPPQPDLHAECHDLVCNGSRDKPRGDGDGCSCRTRASREFGELLALRAVVEAAAEMRATRREAARPPASPPALEALQHLVKVWRWQATDWPSPDKKACADELEKALAVPPEAPRR